MVEKDDKLTWWKIEVDDQIDGGNVQATSSNIGGDKNISGPRLEFLKGTKTI